MGMKHTVGLLSISARSSELPVTLPLYDSVIENEAEFTVCDTRPDTLSEEIVLVCRVVALRPYQNFLSSNWGATILI